MLVIVANCLDYNNDLVNTGYGGDDGRAILTTEQYEVALVAP